MNYEVEFAEGLLPIVRDELIEKFGKSLKIGQSYRPDSLGFDYDGETSKLLELRTVIAIYRVLQFPVPRPKALLGHQYFQELIKVSQQICKTGNFRSLYINAAGSESSVMNRIKEELSRDLSLEIAENEGDLLFRIRKSPQKDGWDVLIRLSPRPIATRDWRVCNYQGALNASVAAAIIALTKPTLEDNFLNIACGSGTMLIERAISMPAKRIIGVDILEDALACARQNITAAGASGIDLIHEDAMNLSFDKASMNAIVADLPFGQLVGSHDENEWLYPAILQEAARVAKKGAHFVIISHEIKLMEACLRNSQAWSIKSAQKISLSGLHPRIFVLERK